MGRTIIPIFGGGTSYVVSREFRKSRRPAKNEAKKVNLSPKTIQAPHDFEIHAAPAKFKIPRTQTLHQKKERLENS